MSNNGANPFEAATWGSILEGEKVFERDGKEYGIRYRAVTPFALLHALGDIPNPLLAAIKDIVGQGGDNEQIARSFVARIDDIFGKMGVLDESLTAVMKEIVIEPPLVEQGNPDGVPVRSIPADWQIEVIIAAVGGMEGINNLFGFLSRQQAATPRVVASPTSR